ncbi:tetratricopeptide repeat-containing sulfotransferase family protein [Roseibium sp. SCP14]|uniref:tetratricopeptide repeat-containing sulfotransferase family protein n=1 Tax=Roseibium sp. SCP14 TaxID=3141375 RepID=UPI00333DEBB2
MTHPNSRASHRLSSDIAAGSQGRQQSVQPVPLQSVLRQIADLYAAGRLSQAHQLCLQVIRQRPRLADAHSMLGVILAGLGKTSEACKALKDAIRFDPRCHYYSNLGELERKNGKHFAAMVALEKAIEIDETYPQAFNNLGIVHFERGEFDKAIDCYKKCIELQPEYPEAHNNIANAYRATGALTEAMAHYDQAVELRENYPEAYNNMGSALRAQERFEEAEFCYRKAIALKPDYGEAANNLAVQFIGLEMYDEALRVLDDALKSGLRTVSLLLSVGRAQMQKSNFELARKACELALEDEADSAAAYTLLGQVDHELDLFEKALRNFERAIEIDPEYAEARNFYGIALKSLGRFDEAREQFEMTLEDNPSAHGTYSNIADLVRFGDYPHFVDRMEEIFKEAENPDSDRYMGLHFALGKAYDDLDRYEEAFEHFSTGANMKRARLDYDEPAIANFFDEIKNTFDADYFANLPFEGDPTELPVFIIGMPRSGSTLAEQIISSHPGALGAGEIKTFSHALGGLRSRFPTLPKFPAMVGRMKPGHFRSVADHYLSYLGNLLTDEICATDKLLTNYYFVGLLSTLFPKARFIHTRRNPVDTCLSAYTKLFKDDMPYSYDLGELGRYYRMYEDLMAHWHRVLPEGVMIDAVYEEVVADTENQAKRLIAHCGLEWDDACLDFHKSKRPVKTASVAQVRKPVYRSSVDRWRCYETQLQPLVEALDYQAD